MFDFLKKYINKDERNKGEEYQVNQEIYKYFREENFGDRYTPKRGYIFISVETGKEKIIYGETIEEKYHELKKDYCIKFQKLGCQLEEPHFRWFTFDGWYIGQVAIYNPYILYQLYSYFYKKHKVNILEINNQSKDDVALVVDKYDIDKLQHNLDGKYRYFHRRRIGDFLDCTFEYQLINCEGKVIKFNDVDIRDKIEKIKRENEKRQVMGIETSPFDINEWFNQTYFNGAKEVYYEVKNFYSEYVYHSDSSRF
mgnify:CR=1 FL=1